MSKNQPPGEALQATTDPEYIAQYFIIHERDDMSIVDLHAELNAGNPVLRTPHIRNASMYNLALMAEGFPVAVLDRTIPHRDTNYHPGHVIHGRQAAQIIHDRDAGRLVTHVTSDHAAYAGRGIVDIHMESLRTAFPKTPIQTLSRYQVETETKRAILSETLACLAKGGFGEWTRRVESDGTLHAIEGQPADETSQHGIFRDGAGHTEQSGVLTPNAINILLFAVLDSVQHDTDQIYHLSGPDMIVYLRTLAPTLDAMYATVRQQCSFGHQLPERIHFHIVPTAYNRFSVPLDRQAEVDRLFAAYDETMAAITVHDVRARSVAESNASKDAKRAQFAALTAARSTIKSALAEVVEGCPWLTDTTASRQYLTQYDVLQAQKTHGNSGIYTPERVRTMSFAEMRALTTELGRMVTNKAKGGNK